MAFPPRPKHRQRLPVLAGGAACLALLAASCRSPADELPERLALSGTLDRDSETSANSVAVPIEYRSEGARGDWWPCDLRLTALGCVDGHHVDVYVGLPQVTSFAGLGRADCVNGDVVEGVYEIIQRKGGQGEYSIGQELSVFVLVASDRDDVSGVDIANDDETRAATRLGSGTFRVDHWGGLAGLGVTIDGVTVGGRNVVLSFQGPTTSTDVIPMAGPDTCVDSALLTEP